MQISETQEITDQGIEVVAEKAATKNIQEVTQKLTTRELFLKTRAVRKKCHLHPRLTITIILTITTDLDTIIDLRIKLINKTMLLRTLAEMSLDL